MSFLRRQRRAGLGAVVFLAALLLYAGTLNAVWATDHATSFLELDYAIWAHHTFALGAAGNFTAGSVDVLVYRGYYYSALAPGAAILALPFAGAGFALDGGFSLFANAMMLTELFVALMNALAAYLVFRISRRYFAPTTSAFLAFAYAFSTTSWPFATFFFQNDVSATFALLAVYFVLGGMKGGHELRSASLAGVAVALATITDYVSALLLVALLPSVAMWSGRPGPRPAAIRSAAFIAFSSLGAAAVGLYDLACYGNPFTTSEQLYLGSSTPFGNFTTPIISGAFLDLFSPLRGILLFTPLLVVGALGLRRMLASPALRRDGLVLLAAFSVLFVPYCAWYGPEGGSSYGPRFVIAAVPFLLVPAGLLYERSWRWALGSYLLYAVGVFINGTGALTSALADEMGWLTSPFLGSGLRRLLAGDLDQAWKGAAGPYWPVACGTVLAAALLLPALAVPPRRPEAPVALAHAPEGLTA